MKTFEIQGSVRENVGGKETKLLRRKALVPCVVYGGEENIHFSVVEKDLTNLLITPNVYIIDLKLDNGKNIKCVLQDSQFHPVSDKPLHLDFLQISEEKPVIIRIPVQLNGIAEGVKQGGKLMKKLRRLKVKGLLANLPDTLDVDVTEVKLGDVVKVEALSFENLEILEAKNAVVAAVKLTRSAMRDKAESTEETEEAAE